MKIKNKKIQDQLFNDREVKNTKQFLEMTSMKTIA